MNLRMFAPLALILALPACSGNPLGNVPEPEAPVVVVPEPGTDGGLTRDGLPPGTTNPSRSSSITRYEATDGTSGSGFVTNVNYNAANDTFAVADLPFDGNGVYTRGVAVRQLNASQTMPYAVYESAPTHNDNLTGGVIGQLQHRAIFAVSTSGQTEFAIVRTGSYVGYGFGGFLYKRNGKVTLPTTGQASYAGDYAGIRDFEGTSGHGIRHRRHVNGHRVRRLRRWQCRSKGAHLESQDLRHQRQRHHRPGAVSRSRPRQVCRRAAFPRWSSMSDPG